MTEPYIKEHNNKVNKKINDYVGTLDYAMTVCEIRTYDAEGTQRFQTIAQFHDVDLDLELVTAKETVRFAKRKLEVIEDQRKKQALEQEEKEKQAREKLEVEFKKRWIAIPHSRPFDCDYCLGSKKGGWRNEENKDDEWIDVCKDCRAKYILMKENPPVPPPSHK